MVGKNQKIVRIKTNIRELDKALSGGIPRGHVTMVSGAAGTMKTSFCFNLLYNAALEGYKGAYITLEQTAHSMLQQAESMGYKLEKIKLQKIPDTTTLFAGITKLNRKNSDLLLIDIANIRRQLAKISKKSNTKHDWLRVIMSTLTKLKEQGLVDIFVLDSLTALYYLSDFKEPRKDIFNAISTLKEIGCTSFLVSEIHPETSVFSLYGVEDYMADGIIKLSTTRKEMKVLGELSVVKMRATPINRDVFVIEYKDKGFAVNPYWIRPTPLP